MDNGKCVLKRRTRLARKTLDPLYQQQLQFEENPEGKVLQVKNRINVSVNGLKSLIFSVDFLLALALAFSPTKADFWF